MDFSSLLPQGLASATDPTRLHAELWADYMSKVMSTWLPLFMATVVVGRDLFGAGIRCFPADLTDIQPGTNDTLAENTSYAPSRVFNDISDYSRQLAEYVDVYCVKQDHHQSLVMFNYQLFTTMLVIQAGVLYVPVLLWNITTARKIICHLRFLMHDTELLYHCHRGDHAATRGSYGQSELVKNINIWIKRDSLYEHYMMKQLVTTVCLAIFITLYITIASLTASNIHDEFLCSVKKKFMVDCAVPSATVHRCVWFTNLILLFLNVACILRHVVSLRYNHYYGSHQPFRELGITLDEPTNDAHLIHMFLRANIESNEKYNYVKVLEDVVTEEAPTTDTTYFVPNHLNGLHHSPSPGPSRRQYHEYLSTV